MSYILTGKLRGSVADDCIEPFIDVSVKFYRPEDEVPETAFTPAVRVLEPEEERGKEFRWVGQARTDNEGEFRIDLSQRSIPDHRGWAGGYDGEPIEADVYCRAVKGSRADQPADPVQCTLGTIRPQWQESDGDHTAHWTFDVPHEFWGQVREKLDVWVISGKVINGDKAPVSGVTVTAFDVDIAEDDVLGTAITDEEGRFRIDYHTKDFKHTPTSYGNYEIGGPDLYFQVHAADSSPIYEEPTSMGSSKERKNVGSCYWVTLQV